MRKKIKYIGFYNLRELQYQRVGAQSAIDKMNYIAQAIIELDYSIEVISPSWIDDFSKKAPFVSSIKISESENKEILFAPSIGTSNKFTRAIKVIFTLAWLFFYLIMNVKQGEKIIMYHSPWFVFPVLLAKKIKKFHLILEVEEIYKDVGSLHPYFDSLEQKIFAKADSFLFSTELLAEKIALERPFGVIYGNYSVIEDKDLVKKTDKKIHLLYAGIIDFEKAGAFNAIEIAPFLNDNYQINIIGFGETQKLIERIAVINEFSDCKIVFDGLKRNEEYISYCKNCDIGLSTQKMSGDYLDTSFPSKILSYLGMGLPVVSCYIPCVAQSKIADLVTFYKEDSPESIAKAVFNISSINRDALFLRMKSLDFDFKKKLEVVLLKK